MPAAYWPRGVRFLLLTLMVNWIRLGAGNEKIPLLKSIIQEDPKELFVPNERQTIADCHFRYHKYAQRPRSSPAAAGGRAAYLREFAHMAAIGWTQEDGTKMWNCGGSLIWENYILTAAHCAADSNNIVPDVARLGDLNLYDDFDDEFAQELSIVEVIRHPEHKFSTKYHDIALMRLEKKVKLHDTAAPACLWSSDENRFKAMEAAGWGKTGFAEQPSPILLKVTLSLVEQERCSVHYLNMRGLRSGLHDNQVCAGDVRMDTCPGDSGGPLQVKLLHNTRLTPFIIGVTSFGTACGLSVPGVYTRVAPYIPWIRSVLSERGEDAAEWKFQPHVCALRYLKYREYEPIVRLGAVENVFEYLDLDNAHLFTANPMHLASIHWNVTTSPVKQTTECYGVIIDESTVVTLARCSVIDGIPPTHIRYGGDKTNVVSRFYRHPQYEENSLYNDIGLLKLQDPLVFSSKFYPACLWHEKDLPVSEILLSGRGPRELTELEPETSQILLNSTSNLLAIGYTHSGTNCSLPYVNTSRLSSGLTEEHLCFGANLFLVPGTCHQSLGGPVQSETSLWDYQVTYVYALNIFGRDCGYGESALGVKIAHHKEWMQSVLLPEKKEEDKDVPLVFLDQALGEGDHCEPSRGSNGICVDAQHCPKVLHDYQMGRKVRFCERGSLLCCPRDLIRNETDAEWREIDGCETRRTNLKRVRNIRQHVVSLLWNSENDTKNCTGTIITGRTIVVAANCFRETLMPGLISFKQSKRGVSKPMEVEKVIIHPEFDRSTKQNNIALIQMKYRLESSLGKEPACLWTNTTHTPFYLSQIFQSPQKTDQTDAFPKYSADCERTFGRVLEPYELCVDVRTWGSWLVIGEDEPALWRKWDIGFLVGISSRRSANDSSVFLHTRLSSYASWIKSVL